MSMIMDSSSTSSEWRGPNLDIDAFDELLPSRWKHEDDVFLKMHEGPLLSKESSNHSVNTDSSLRGEDSSADSELGNGLNSEENHQANWFEQDTNEEIMDGDGKGVNSGDKDVLEVYGSETNNKDSPDGHNQAEPFEGDREFPPNVNNRTSLTGLSPISEEGEPLHQNANESSTSMVEEDELLYHVPTCDIPQYQNPVFEDDDVSLDPMSIFSNSLEEAADGNAVTKVKNHEPPPTEPDREFDGKIRFEPPMLRLENVTAKTRSQIHVELLERPKQHPPQGRRLSLSNLTSINSDPTGEKKQWLRRPSLTGWLSREPAAMPAPEKAQNIGLLDDMLHEVETHDNATKTGANYVDDVSIVSGESAVNRRDARQAILHESFGKSAAFALHPDEVQVREMRPWRMKSQLGKMNAIVPTGTQNEVAKEAQGDDDASQDNDDESCASDDESFIFHIPKEFERAPDPETKEFDDVWTELSSVVAESKQANALKVARRIRSEQIKGREATDETELKSSHHKKRPKHSKKVKKESKLLHDHSHLDTEPDNEMLNKSVKDKGKSRTSSQSEPSFDLRKYQSRSLSQSDLSLDLPLPTTDERRQEVMIERAGETKPKKVKKHKSRSHSSNQEDMSIDLQTLEKSNEFGSSSSLSGRAQYSLEPNKPNVDPGISKSRKTKEIRNDGIKEHGIIPLNPTVMLGNADPKGKGSPSRSAKNIDADSKGLQILSVEQPRDKPNESALPDSSEAKHQRKVKRKHGKESKHRDVHKSPPGGTIDCSDNVEQSRSESSMKHDQKSSLAHEANLANFFDSTGSFPEKPLEVSSETGVRSFCGSLQTDVSNVNKDLTTFSPAMGSIDEAPMKLPGSGLQEVQDACLTLGHASSLQEFFFELTDSSPVMSLEASSNAGVRSFCGSMQSEMQNTVKRSNSKRYLTMDSTGKPNKVVSPIPLHPNRIRSSQGMASLGSTKLDLLQQQSLATQNKSNLKRVDAGSSQGASLVGKTSQLRIISSPLHQTDKLNINQVREIEQGPPRYTERATTTASPSQVGAVADKKTTVSDGAGTESLLSKVRGQVHHNSNVSSKYVSLSESNDMDHESDVRHKGVRRGWFGTKQKSDNSLEASTAFLTSASDSLATTSHSTARKGVADDGESKARKNQYASAESATRGQGQHRVKDTGNFVVDPRERKKIRSRSVEPLTKADIQQSESRYVELPNPSLDSRTNHSATETRARKKGRSRSVEALTSKNIKQSGSRHVELSQDSNPNLASRSNHSAKETKKKGHSSSVETLTSSDIKHSESRVELAQDSNSSLPSRTSHSATETRERKNRSRAAEALTSTDVELCGPRHVELPHDSNPSLNSGTNHSATGTRERKKGRSRSVEAFTSKDIKQSESRHVDLSHDTSHSTKETRKKGHSRSVEALTCTFIKHSESRGELSQDSNPRLPSRTSHSAKGTRKKEGHSHSVEPFTSKDIKLSEFGDVDFSNHSMSSKSTGMRGDEAKIQRDMQATGATDKMIATMELSDNVRRKEHGSSSLTRSNVVMEFDEATGRYVQKMKKKSNTSKGRYAIEAEDSPPQQKFKTTQKEGRVKSPIDSDDAPTPIRRRNAAPKDHRLRTEPFDGNGGAERSGRPKVTEDEAALRKLRSSDDIGIRLTTQGVAKLSDAPRDSLHKKGGKKSKRPDRGNDISLSMDAIAHAHTRRAARRNSS